MPESDRTIEELIEDLDYLLEEANISIQREQFYMKNIDEISGENYHWEQEYPSKDAWEQDIVFNHNGLWDVQNEINRISHEYTSDVDELFKLNHYYATRYKNKFLYNYRMEQRGGKKRRSRNNKKSRKIIRKQKPAKSAKKSRQRRRKTYKKKSHKKSGKKYRK